LKANERIRARRLSQHLPGTNAGDLQAEYAALEEFPLPGLADAMSPQADALCSGVAVWSLSREVGVVAGSALNAVGIDSNQTRCGPRTRRIRAGATLSVWWALADCAHQMTVDATLAPCLMNDQAFRRKQRQHQKVKGRLV
jgi:hypothetical protein